MSYSENHNQKLKKLVTCSVVKVEVRHHKRLKEPHLWGSYRLKWFTPQPFSTCTRQSSVLDRGRVVGGGTYLHGSIGERVEWDKEVFCNRYQKFLKVTTWVFEVEYRSLQLFTTIVCSCSLWNRSLIVCHTETQSPRHLLGVRSDILFSVMEVRGWGAFVFSQGIQKYNH